MKLVLELSAGWRLAHSADSAWATTDNPAVDCAADAVLHLDVELGKDVELVSRGLLDVTHGAAVHHVLHSETHHSLVLGDLAAAAIAGDLHAERTAVLAVAAVVSSLHSHL